MITESEKKMKKEVKKKQKKNPIPKPPKRMVTINGKQLPLIGNRAERRTAESMLRKTKHEKIKCTIKEYFDGERDITDMAREEMFKDEKFFPNMHNVNADPIHQRPPVKKWFGSVEQPQYDPKMSAIIETLLWKGYNCLDIIVHKDEFGLNWIYESIDGGHRKRAVRYFKEGKLAIKTADGKQLLTWNALTEEEQEYFDNIEMTFSVYEGLNNFEKGDLFRSLNDSTHVNQQEQLNAYGDIDFANGIRALVRGIECKEEYKQHPFFYTDNSDGYLYHDGQNGRLKLEELVTKISRLVMENGLVAGKFENYSHMFEWKAFPYSAMNKFLDLLVQLSKARKESRIKSSPKLSVREIRYFTFFHFYLGNYKIKDWDAFYISFEGAYRRFYDNKDKVWGKMSKEESGKTKGKMIDTWSAQWDKLDSLTKVAKALKDNFENFDDIITPLSSKRVASQMDQETQFRNQGMVCAVEQALYDAGVIKKLNRAFFDKCDCAHIDRFIDGSECELGDFKMIKTEYHKLQHKLGYNNLNEFIDFYVEDRKLEKAA